MGLMGRLAQAFRPPLATKVFDPSGAIGDLSQIVGWRSVGGSNTYSFYKDHQYENGYSSISKLANGFAQLEQYTVDKNGKSVASNVLDRLYTPNTDMSHYDFREALAVTTLVHDKVRLRVHHRGNTSKFNAEAILGFTFMEDYSEYITEDMRHYRMANGDVLTDAEVVTLKSVNPDKITEGFSPSRAAKRWTRLDDYIADYQRGFFENGAIPSGQLIITAKTKTEFNDIVDVLQERHKGAGKSNNVTYTHRPTDQEGKPINSQIEWVPFSTQNKDMALKDLFAQVNQKIDSAYGVPASIRGVNDQNTYASVRVDEVIFVKYALNPMALKIWSKFTHELNRITGGTGVAITYDLEVPKIADEELIKAQAKQTDAATVSTLVLEGYTLASAVDYVKTGLLESLVLGKAPQKDEPEVLSTEEARGTPDQPLDIYAKRVKQLSVRDMPDLYTELQVDQAMVGDASLRGCIMLKTEALEILSLVPNAESDLATEVDMDRSPVPGETSPHVTLLYGLLNNGNTWKSAVDNVLDGWEADSVTIDEVGFFTLPDSYAIIAHIKKTTELVDGHDRIGLLPNAETFSEYKPHITLAYIKKDADLGKWIKTLGEVYNGEKLETAGIDYGDQPTAKKVIKTKQLGIIDRELYIQKMSKVINSQMTRQVFRAIDKIDEALKTKAYGDNTELEDELFTKEMLDILYPLMAIYGNKQTNTGINLVLQAGLVTDDIRPFEFTASQRKAYQDYLAKVGTSYAEQTAEQIRQVLGQGILDGATKHEITDKLKQVILGPENEYRITRLARSEINLSEGKASVSSMQNIAAQTGYKIYKVWVNGGSDPCEFCKAKNGTRVLVDDNFVDKDTDVHGVDGGTYKNDFAARDSAHLHPNDECYDTYEVERG
jgi:phage portal protein BeeE